MPRFPRINFEGALYYVATKVDYKLALFRDDSDKSYYISLISDYKSKYNFKLYTLALISNETHLLIEPSSNFTISQIMHDINANYTKYYNKKYSRKGHLFKERFRAILVEKEVYLKEMTRYIHRTVLKNETGISFDNYRWSSYAVFTKAPVYKDLNLEIDCEEVLKGFSEDREKQVMLYRDFVQNASMDELNELKKKLHRTALLGSKDFRRKIEQILIAKKIESQEESKKLESVAVRKMRRGLIYAMACLITMFLGLNTYFLKSNSELNKAIEEARSAKDLEFHNRLSQAEKNLKNDLEEKYRADIVSYNALVKLLESEKKKSKN